MTLKKPPIYISYAWGKDDDSEENRVVDALCEALKERGYEYVRDKDYVQYLDSLLNFFKTIGGGGYVISIVGDKYLRSENCMIEATHMIQKGNLGLRVFPILLSDLKGVFTIDGRNTLITDLERYWKPQETKLQEVLKNLDSPTSFIEMRTDASMVTRVVESVSTLVNHLGTALQISSEQQISKNFEQLLAKIEARIDEDYKQLTEYMGMPPEGARYYQRFSAEYIGRAEDIRHVLDFLNDPSRHFMLLYGVGGMGKSHLISECRKEFDSIFLRHEECTVNYNLKSLFKTCGIKFPDELESSEERIRFFLDEFTQKSIHLILDDFYETIDAEIRGMLTKLASIPNGKVLLVSRAIPTELEGVGVAFEKYFIPPLKKEDFDTVLLNYVNSEQKLINITPQDLQKIFEKAQGYPLGGQLIIDLLDLGEDLDEILSDLPKFEAEIDEEGRKFSGRLLDNIFTKGNEKEIKLLCEFSALFGASSKELIKQLPSYNLKLFDALANRRRFIWKDETGSFNSHAMIKDYAYEKLSDKSAIHKILGKYFENKLFAIRSLNSEFLESATQHYVRTGSIELKKFGEKLSREFNIGNVKSLIDKNVKDTIRNYKSVLEISPDKMAFYNELGIAYRANNQKQLAIETFLDAIEIDAEHLPSYNELGITYRENNQKQLAIETFQKAIEIEPKNLPSYNELGITYRENNQKQLAIETFLDAIEIDAEHLPSYNELGITYRENNQKQLAIETFQDALKVEADNVRILNELGITYRENNQKQLAIETFQKAIEIDPKHLHSYNELGITYRENNQFEEAIRVCDTAVRLGNMQSYLNLLQIYLFFHIDLTNARAIFNELYDPSRRAGFGSKRKPYRRILENLDAIWSLSFDGIDEYKSYVYAAIRNRAYQTVLPLLFKLNDKFPDNSRLLSHLGKTLSNQVIGRAEEGYRFLKQAIHLFKLANNQIQYEGHILYYLYNLSNNERHDLLPAEIALYKDDIQYLPAFHRFLATYYESLKKPEKEIIECYKKAFELSEDNEEKLRSIELLIEYLTRTAPDKSAANLEKLRTTRKELYKRIAADEQT